MITCSATSLASQAPSICPLAPARVLHVQMQSLLPSRTVHTHTHAHKMLSNTHTHMHMSVASRATHLPLPSFRARLPQVGAASRQADQRQALLEDAQSLRDQLAAERALLSARASDLEALRLDLQATLRWGWGGAACLLRVCVCACIPSSMHEA